MPRFRETNEGGTRSDERQLPRERADVALLVLDLDLLAIGAIGAIGAVAATSQGTKTVGGCQPSSPAAASRSVPSKRDTMATTR